LRPLQHLRGPLPAESRSAVRTLIPSEPAAGRCRPAELFRRLLRVPAAGDNTAL